MRAPTPRPSPPRSRRRGRSVTHALTALGSLAVITALLAGLPALLWWATRIVLEAGLDDLTHLTGRQDTGAAFLLVLAAVGWIAWAQFAIAIVVEVPAQLRGRAAPRLRGAGLGSLQRAAATLVGAILVLLPTSTALASPTPAQAATAATTPGHHSGAEAEANHTSTPGHTEPAATESPGRPRYTVRDARPAESLWTIAEQQLGDGQRWEEIAALNEGRTMPDGEVFHADAPLQPGWQLHLPDDAHTPADANSNAPAAHSESGRSVTVSPGDNLSGIAETELGDPTAWPGIFELNQGEPQPGGRTFTNPDLIYPGQELDLPTAGPAPKPPPNNNDRDDSDSSRDGGSGGDGGQHTDPPPSHSPDDSGEGDDEEATPAPDNAAPPAAPPPDTTTPTGPASPSPGTTTAAPAGEGDDTGSPLRNVALVTGIGALLAAGLAGALTVKRILAQRRRQAGQTVAIDPDPSRFEEVLHATAEPASVHLLDLALRTLAHHAQTAGADLPVLRGAQVTDRLLRLIVDDPAAKPLAPFTAGEHDGQWVLDGAVPLLDADQAQGVPAPYPGLVTLGADNHGHLLLVNLLHGGPLFLDGTPSEVLEVTRALALEAGTSDWSDHTEIITVGLGGRLATLLPKGRVRAMPHLPSVIADLGALLVEVHQAEGSDGQDAPGPLPWLLICASDVDAEQAWQLADAHSTARNLPLAVVLPAGDATRAAFPDAETIPAAPDTQVTLGHLGAEPIQLQRLTDDQYRQYVHALQVADEPAHPATGAWQLAEDHNQPAATARPTTDPLLPHGTADSHTGTGTGDLGSPFPALLASAHPARIHLATPSGATADPDIDESADADNPDRPGEPAPDRAREPVRTVTAETPNDVDDEGGHEPGEPPEPAPPTTTQRQSHAHNGGDDPDAPAINVLGPIQVTGITGSGHGPKLAALAALIHLRPGRSADALCTAMDPASPWSRRTLQSRLSELRSRLGNDPSGHPYLPRPHTGTGQAGGYALTPAVRSDWHTFQHLATRALTAGPEAGTADLEDALALVRGKPFDGRDYPWAAPVQQEILSRIVDIAHTLAVWHTEADPPDYDAARHAALRGLDIDDTAEVLHRDVIHIEAITGNQAGVHRAITRLHHMARTYDITPEPLTEHTINHALNPQPQGHHT